MRFSLLAVAVVASGLVVGAARAEDRSAEAILKEIEAVPIPQFDPSQGRDQTAIQAYLTKRREALAKRNPLILELYKSDPGNERLPELMSERWHSMSPVGTEGEALKKELEEVAKSANEQLKAEALFFQVRQAAMMNRDKPEVILGAVDRFLKEAPKDPRGGGLLYGVSQMLPEEKQKALEERVLKEYPESGEAQMIQALRTRREAVGKPFELEFTDAISGKPVSMQDLKGKVVVIDFWATWCGPCVAEMPHMKELYKEYQDKGVEFIGVSLDQPKEEGGLKALKEFVEKNEIEWPQYYQGNGWESKFSRSWGINAIPAMFVVDADGKLYSIEARGKLEELLPKLLEKADAAE